MSIEIREFEQSIVNYVNGSKLSVEVKRLVLAEILHKVENAANEQIRLEAIARENKEDAEC